MRTQKSFKNIIMSCLSYGTMMLGGFLIKGLFTSTLGTEIFGIEGTFSRILSALSIVEMGLGFGMAYKLYKPIANKDWNQISIILCFCRKAYLVISAIILFLGVSISFFVGIPIEENYPTIWLAQLFLLCIVDILASYLYAHKRMMLIADNKEYINNTVHIILQIIMFISQAFVLIFFRSFELYLVCKVVCRFVENFVISYIFNKNYKFINLKIKEKLLSIERKDLFKNIKALLFHKITSFSIRSGSGIIVYFFLNLFQTGIYGIYDLITISLTNVTTEIFNGILASFGNLLSTEGKEKAYKNFNVIFFVNFLLYSFITVSFFNIITPFISVWPSKGEVLVPFDLTTTIFITAYLYLYGMRQSINAVKMGMGLNSPDKYMAVFGATLSLILSIIFAKWLGITGIIFGSIIGLLAVPYWVQPKLVYEIIFKKKVNFYHRKFALYTMLTAIYMFITYFICSKIRFSNCILQIIINVFVCLIVPNLLNILIFFKTEEFKNLLSAFKSILKKFKLKSF